MQQSPRTGWRGEHCLQATGLDDIMVAPSVRTGSCDIPPECHSYMGSSPVFFPHQKAPPPHGGERSDFSRNPSPAPAIFRRQGSMILWLLPVCALAAVTFHRNVTVIWVRVLSFFRTKRLPHRMVREPFGAGDRTRTCTAMPEEPKSTESTNSTTPAKKKRPLFLHGGGTRGGAYRFIRLLSFYHGPVSLSIRKPGQTLIYFSICTIRWG